MTRPFKAAVTGDRSKVGLFIPLPRELAELFPSLAPVDDSPPHITFFYSGPVPADQEELWFTLVDMSLRWLRSPVRAVLDGDVEYFEQPSEGRTAVVTPVRFSEDLSHFNWEIRENLRFAGFELSGGYPLVYRPHATLGYVDGFDVEWHGTIPQGSFEFSEFEVWGLPSKKKVPFGQDSLERPTFSSVSWYDQKNNEKDLISRVASDFLSRGG